MTGGDTHYMSIFVTSPADNPCGYQSVLLAPAPIGEKDDLAAEKRFDFLEFVLSVYVRSISSVVALNGDN